MSSSTTAPSLPDALAAAVYELSTVRPQQPPRKRYGRAEWPAYCDGYYQALAAVLRVIRPAARRWKERYMSDKSIHVINGQRSTVAPDPSPSPAADRWMKPLLVAIALTAAVFALELLVLGAAVIYRVVW